MLALPPNRANQQLLPEREGVHLPEPGEALHGRGPPGPQQLERKEGEEKEG